LTASPKESIDLLTQKLEPQPPIAPERLAELISQLDHPRFSVRERATKELESLTDQVEGAVQKAMVGANAEVEQRLERVLNAASRPLLGGDQLRTDRAIDALERMATPEARQLLRKLARGSGVAARDARDALARLQDR
jgi:hypothetical protein